MRRLKACLMAWVPVSRRRFEEVKEEAERLSLLLTRAAKRIGVLEEENRKLAMMMPYWFAKHTKED